MTTIFSDLIVNNDANISRLNFTGMNCSSLTVNSLTVNNIYSTNSTTSTFSNTNLTATNTFSTNLTATNEFASNLTATNTFASNLRTTNTFSTNLTATSAFASNLTGTNSYATNLTANNYGIFNSVKVSKGNNNQNTNVSIGNASLELNTTGINNIAIGIQTMRSITTQSNNIAIGGESGKFITGSNNIAFVAMLFGGSINNNNSIGIGGNSYFASSGDSNTAIGVISAYGCNTKYSTFLGFSSGRLTNYDSTIAIGSTATTSITGQISLGRNTDTINIQGGMNYKVGPIISSTIPIASPTSQFFVIENGSTEITITLPTILSGAFINFKRGSSSTGNIVFSYATSVIISTNSITPNTTTPTYGSTFFNFSFISDGTYWYEII